MSQSDIPETLYGEIVFDQEFGNYIGCIWRPVGDSDTPIRALSKKYVLARLFRTREEAIDWIRKDNI